MTESQEDPVLKSSRREAIIVGGLWIAAMLYSVLFSWTYGYPKSFDTFQNEKIKLIWGIPFWVFWGVMIPWVVCAVLSILIGCLFMKDQPLGEDLSDDESDLLN